MIKNFILREGQYAINKLKEMLTSEPVSKFFTVYSEYCIKFCKSNILSIEIKLFLLYGWM